MEYINILKKHLPFILKNIKSSIYNDPTIYQFVSKEELEKLLNIQEKLIEDYLLSFNEKSLDERKCYQFYKDLTIPYAIIIKSLNLLKTELLKKLILELDKSLIAELNQHFQYFIDLVAKVYLKKEITSFKNRKQLNDYYLLTAHKDFLNKIIEVIQKDDISLYPIDTADNCQFIKYMEYLESMMVCMDINLCNYLHDLHTLLHKLANSFYFFYKRGSYNEAYLVFKDFKEIVFKFENVIVELHFVTFTDLEGSFFKFIEIYNSPGNEYITMIDLKGLKYLNQIYLESTVTKAIKIVEEKIKNLLSQKDKYLVIRGITADFYIYSSNVLESEYIEIIEHIKNLIETPVKVDDKTVTLSPIIIGIQKDESISIKSNEYIKIFHSLKKRAKEEGIQKNLLLDEKGKKILQNFLSDKYDMSFIKSKIDNEQITLHFQPIVTTEKKELFAIEALARIKDSKRLIPAGVFIERVLEFDLIDQFDIAILRHILEMKEKIQKAAPRLFININAQSLKNSTYIELLDQILNTLNIEIILEITEQTMLYNLELIQTIHKKHNVFFAADDFGTGYTSIKTITDMAKNKILKVLKIDGSLVKNMHNDIYDQKTINVVAHLAKEFGLYSVAEFVENEKILELLKYNGIEFAQGFHIAKPMDLDEILLNFK